MDEKTSTRLKAALDRHDDRPTQLRTYILQLKRNQEFVKEDIIPVAKKIAARRRVEQLSPPPPPPQTDITKEKEVDNTESDTWQSPAERELAKLIDTATYYYKFGSDTICLMDIIKFRNVSLPKRFMISPLYNFAKPTFTGTKSTPSTKCISFLVHTISHLADLSVKDMFDREEHYGDLFYAVNSLAAWLKGLDYCTNATITDMIDDLGDFIQEYIKTYFEDYYDKSQNAVVFTPRIKDFDSALSQSVDISDGADAVIGKIKRGLSTDTHLYVPQSFFNAQHCTIDYPKYMYDKTWCLNILHRNITAEYYNISACFLHMHVYSYFQRYACWGMAILAIVFAIYGADGFKRVVIPYLKTLTNDQFQSLTTAQLFPGLYTMLLFSRPGFNLQTRHTTPPILYPFVVHFSANLAFTKLIDDIPIKRVEPSESKIRQMDLATKTTRDITQQFLEDVVNQIFIKARNQSDLGQKVTSTAYSDVYRFMGRSAKEDYIKLGFTCEKMVKDPNTSFLDSIKATAS